MELFLPISKVDVEKREVWGRAAHEVPDRAKEIFDYATSKPLFESWSSEVEKASDGKSLGNIRSMHKTIAAGKVTSIDFNDVEKAIDIGTKIVDDDEWKKVEEGVYTGFSIGGKYVKKWADGEFTRYTAAPGEISLVDRPCIPTATYTLVKADGSVEEVAFKNVEAPTDTAAVPTLKKSMWSVADFAMVMNGIRNIAADSQWEAEIENDGSPIPAQLRAWAAGGAKIFAAMAAEEVAELVTLLQPPGEPIVVLELSAPAGELAKKGARHSKADAVKLQAIHDHAAALGADCSASKVEASGGLSKVLAPHLTELGKAVAIATGSESDSSGITADDIGALGKYTIAAAEKATALESEREILTKRVKELESEPQPPKGVLRTVAKADDVTDVEKAAATKIEESDDPITRMKKVHAAGGLQITTR